MGRPRKPVEALILGGNFRASRHSDRITPLPLPNADTPPLEPPSYLTPEQADIWREKRDSLPRGFIAPEQADVFARWCVAWSLWKESSAIIAESGVVIDGTEGKARNPATLVQAQALDQLRRLEAALRFGDTDYIRRVTPAPRPPWFKEPA